VLQVIVILHKSRDGGSTRRSLHNFIVFSNYFYSNGRIQPKKKSFFFQFADPDDITKILSYSHKTTQYENNFDYVNFTFAKKTGKSWNIQILAKLLKTNLSAIQAQRIQETHRNTRIDRVLTTHLSTG
jgi:hypothetical protein